MAGEHLMGLRTRTKGLDAAITHIGMARKAMGDMRTVWRQFHNGRPKNKGGLPQFRNFIQIERDHFRTHGGYGGTKWAPYTKEEWHYLLRFKAFKVRAKDGWDGTPMLRWTKSKSIRPQAKERLYPSFVNVKHKDHVFISKKRRMEVGSKTPWASKHHAGRGQYASGIGSSKVQWSLVKRSLIGVTKHDTRNIARLIQRKVMRNFGTKARRSL